MEHSRILALLKELVAANSENPPGRESQVAKILQNHMEAHGISCQTVGSNNRPNLLFSTHDGQKGNLLLHGHMDTVPVGNLERWSFDPFGSEVVNGRLYGRGACDMKGPIAALSESMIVYAEEKHKQPLLMLNTSDEESGCSGAEEVAQSGILKGVRFGLCAEPTSLQILVGEKGLFWTRIVVTGKSAHGSRPDEGINAITSCIEAIRILTSDEYPYEQDELLGCPTINIGTIRGGLKVNVVPDTCEAELDMRIVKGQEPKTLLELMKSRLSSSSLSERVKVENLLGKPAVLTPPESPIVQITKEEVEELTGKPSPLGTATYGTDCSVLQPKCGIQNVICGPGSIEHAHQPDEHIQLEQLYQATEIYLRIARRFDK